MLFEAVRQTSAERGSAGQVGHPSTSLRTGSAPRGPCRSPLVCLGGHL